MSNVKTTTDKDRRLLVLILLGCLTLLPNIELKKTDQLSADQEGLYYFYLGNDISQPPIIHRISKLKQLNSLSSSKYLLLSDKVVSGRAIRILNIADKSSIYRLSPPPYYALFFGFPLQINLADNQTLNMLPGIGPSLASRIMDFRSEHGIINDLQSLQGIQGIGPILIEKLRPLLSFDQYHAESE